VVFETDFLSKLPKSLKNTKGGFQTDFMALDFGRNFLPQAGKHIGNGNKISQGNFFSEIQPFGPKLSQGRSRRKTAQGDIVFGFNVLEDDLVKSSRKIRKNQKRIKIRRSKAEVVESLNPTKRKLRPSVRKLFTRKKTKTRVVNTAVFKGEARNQLTSESGLSETEDSESRSLRRDRGE